MGIKSSITGSLRRAGENIGNLIYPNVCLHCEGIGENGIDLCGRCYENLPWNQAACKRCALPLPSGDAESCGACSKRELYFDHATAAFQFEGFIQDAVYQFKFNQKLNQGKLLAQLLLSHVKANVIETPDIIIPVPLHKNRIRQRGYNQALEIARIISVNLGCELSYNEIFRNRDTSVQMELPAKQRAKNVLSLIHI